MEKTAETQCLSGFFRVSSKDKGPPLLGKYDYIGEVLEDILKISDFFGKIQKNKRIGNFEKGVLYPNQAFAF